MWNKKLQEIKKMNAIFGEEINDGATEKDIQRFLEEIGDVISEEYLHPYINVLKRVNGLEFNGFILYGIDSTLLNNEPKQPINGFIDNNRVWHENEWQRKYIFFGDSNTSWYTYDLLTNKYGSIIFLMGLAPNVLGYRHPAAILDRSKNKCCGLITDGEELKNNQLCFSVDTTVLHLFSDLSRTCPRTSGGWIPPLALTPKNNRSVSFLVA